ncbi:MAG: helix-turn-helix domain-containing protein [Actinomycetes bacterium]
MAPRFITLAEVAGILNIAPSQVYSLVRAGELPAIKIGARGQWRVETAQLEKYITDMYSQTAHFVANNPR